uniref:CSON011754 protein n=2 Tax=Culicoides sonorensis TaxID=179676 RepID=A0A336M7Y5_CULSO
MSKGHSSNTQEKHDYILFHPLEAEQMLLPETASYLAVKTYFKMLGLPLKCQSRINAEFMSPGGSKTKLPVLKYGNTLVSEFLPIVEFLEHQGFTLWSQDYDKRERENWKATLEQMDNTFTNAELFVCWMEDAVRETITYPRYGSPYAWPLNHIQSWRKFRQVKKILDVDDWLDFDMAMVGQEIKDKCRSLSELLQDRPYFNGSFPTEFDALMFGHLMSFLKNLYRLKITRTSAWVPYCRYLHKTHIFFDKNFKETENEFAHRILASAGVSNMLKQEDLYSLFTSSNKSIDSILTKNFQECSIDQLMTYMVLVAKYCMDNNIQISDRKFDGIVDCLADRRFELNDEQLIKGLKLLMILPKTPSKHTRNYWDLWLAFEQVCLERCQNWDVDKRLFFTDIFYQLNLGRTTKLTYNVVMRMGRNIPKLSKNHLLQMLFFLNITRQPIEEMINIELNFIKSIDHMTIGEVSVICMGFFKTETRIRNPELLRKLYEKLKANLSSIDNIPLVNIFKVLRYSSKNNEQHLIRELLDAIVPQLSRFSLLSCLHIALLGTDLQQCHESSLKIIVKRFYDEIDNARLKDIERICFVIGLFDFKFSDGLERKLAELILNELKKRVDEIALYPKALSQTMSYIALIDPCYVSKEMLNICLNPEFLKSAYGKNYYNYGREVIFLDSFAEVFYGNNYKGHRLVKRIKNYLTNISIDYIPDPSRRQKLTFSNRLLLEVFESCKDIFKYSRIYHVLPHFQRPDIILAVNTRTKKGIDISVNYPEKTSSLILTSSLLLETIEKPEDIKLVALVIGGWNQMIRGTSSPTGLLKNKILQLNLCGFEVIVIDWQHWPKTKSEQIVYLNQKIFEKI